MTCSLRDKNKALMKFNFESQKAGNFCCTFVVVLLRKGIRVLKLVSSFLYSFTIIGVENGFLNPHGISMQESSLKVLL